MTTRNINAALVGYNATPPGAGNEYATKADVGGGGSVTSVAQTVPVEFSIAGSPITTSGTLAISKVVQNANKVWAGPTTGTDADPAFRALVTADMPAGTGTMTQPQVLARQSFGGF